VRVDRDARVGDRYAGPAYAYIGPERDTRSPRIGTWRWRTIRGVSVRVHRAGEGYAAGVYRDTALEKDTRSQSMRTSGRRGLRARRVSGHCLGEGYAAPVYAYIWLEKDTRTTRLGTLRWRRIRGVSVCVHRDGEGDADAVYSRHCAGEGYTEPAYADIGLEKETRRARILTFHWRRRRGASVCVHRDGEGIRARRVSGHCAGAGTRGARAGSPTSLQPAVSLPSACGHLMHG